VRAALSGVNRSGPRGLAADHGSRWPAADAEKDNAGVDTARRSAGRLADTTARVASNPTQIKNNMSARANRLRSVLQAID